MSRALVKHNANDYFQVHGNGGTLSRESMGDKMWQLFVKLDAVLGVDLHMVKRHVLSMEFVQAYLKRCGAERAILDGDFGRARRHILAGKLTGSELGAIERLCKDLGIYPALVVRNSAFGDAGGSGKLGESKYSLNNAEMVAEYVKAVIASYYTQESALFRKDTGLAEGIAIGIEPMVEQKAMQAPENWEEQTWTERAPQTGFAPLLSGFAHTSNRIKFAGCDETNRGPNAGIVRGLAGEYMTDAGRGIEISGYLGREFDDLNFKKRQSQKSSFDNYTLFLGTDGKMHSMKVEFGKGGLGFGERETQINGFFAKLEALEAACQERQRVEFAMKHIEGKPAYHIAQINGAPQSSFEFKADFDAPGVVGTAKAVHGCKDGACGYLVRLKNAEGTGHLKDIATPHALVIAPEKSGDLRNYAPSQYGDMRHAFSISTVAEKYNTDGGLGIISDHLGEMLHMTDKIFMVFGKFDWPNLEKRAEKLPEKYPGIDIYRADFRVAGSDYTQQGILEIRG